MFQAVIVFGLATVVFGASHSVWISILALAVMGAADTVSVVVRSSLVQLATPDEMCGRVSAVTIAVALLWMKLFPTLRRVESLDGALAS